MCIRDSSGPSAVPLTRHPWTPTRPAPTVPASGPPAAGEGPLAASGAAQPEAVVVSRLQSLVPAVADGGTLDPAPFSSPATHRARHRASAHSAPCSTRPSTRSPQAVSYTHLRAHET